MLPFTNKSLVLIVSISTDLSNIITSIIWTSSVKIQVPIKKSRQKKHFSQFLARFLHECKLALGTLFEMVYIRPQ